MFACSGADDGVPAAALEWESESHERTAVFPTGTVIHLTDGFDCPISSCFHQVSLTIKLCGKSYPTWPIGPDRLNTFLFITSRSIAGEQQ